MKKALAQAHVDSTLMMSINALLNEGISDPVGGITNLMTFAHATILFDNVTIPIWDLAHKATSYLPISIVPKNIFKDALDPDYEGRMKECIVQSVSMSSPTLSNKKQSKQPGQLTNSISSLVRKILSAEGQPWPVAFRQHLQYMLKTQDELLINEGKRVMDTYALDDSYLLLPLEEKMALTYLWRCLYNVSLSFENQRPYLHNIYRLPFVNAIYRYIKEQTLALPIAKQIAWSENFNNTDSTINKVLLPSLLGSVLSKVTTRDQIIPAILEIREGKKARSFRSYYGELQEKLGEPGAYLEMEKDIKHLVDLWSNISDPIPVPIKFSVESQGTTYGAEYVGDSKITAWIGRHKMRHSKPHLRFAVYLLDHPEFCKQLSHSVTKIFGTRSQKITSGQRRALPRQEKPNIEK